MKSDRFPYEASRWSPAQPDQAKRWFEELETQSPLNVRNRLTQTDAGPAGAVTIGTTEMTIGFAEDWLAWHDRKREASEDKRHRKHWLDWAGWVVAVISMCIAAFTTYRTVLIQRDDIRVVVDGVLRGADEIATYLYGEGQDSSALIDGYVGVPFSQLTDHIPGVTGASQVDFDLSMKFLDDAELVKIGPMEMYDNPPGSRVIVLGFYSKREYAYLTETGYRVPTDGRRRAIIASQSRANPHFRGHISPITNSSW
ncbi:MULTISPECIES: hypothetical protein [Bradyrhizobium]|uniref:Uncharacterized protein n=1 Tax=Bradyrhizobium frederickii TaxID=2560054 RepID=A0A4Y9KUV9_9BRAD|nr:MULTISPECIES: hypothetical protein [Bradyrhizobium]RTE88235.1 hypothetical protein D6B98_36945 [Bradyrhizobium sp. LVM 105]TFV30271.1 hypothetical protein E4K66_35765 [Bradyrhizobium frederickii]TFV68507.1 hypothetical protein E4K64_36685 [Bradyrhizobium frederickii]